MVKVNVSSDPNVEIHVDRFTRKWVCNDPDKTKCFTFDTIEEVDTREVTQGNQETTTFFRLDITPHDATVNTVGDSSYGGFLVCEDASELFDVDLLCKLVEEQDPPPMDVQEEYDRDYAEGE